MRKIALLTCLFAMLTLGQQIQPKPYYYNMEGQASPGGPPGLGLIIDWPVVVDDVQYEGVSLDPFYWSIDSNPDRFGSTHACIVITSAWDGGMFTVWWY